MNKKSGHNVETTLSISPTSVAVSLTLPSSDTALPRYQRTLSLIFGRPPLHFPQGLRYNENQKRKAVGMEHTNNVPSRLEGPRGTAFINGGEEYSAIIYFL